MTQTVNIPVKKIPIRLFFNWPHQIMLISDFERFLLPFFVILEHQIINLALSIPIVYTYKNRIYIM